MLTLNTTRLGWRTLYKQDFKVKGYNLNDNGQSNIKLTLNIHRLSWIRVYKHDYKVEGLTFKDKGQKGQNDRQCASPMLVWYALKIWSGCHL